MRLLTKPSMLDRLPRIRTVGMAAAGIGMAACALFAWTMLGSCSGGSKDESKEAEEYHADNDIAMTIRSVSDAFVVGEPLHDKGYHFEGVLTDGAGMPLYTDIMGSPGQWSVDVVSANELRIHNLYLGDLLPENLRQYLEQSLDLEEPVRRGTVRDAEDSEIEISEYILPGGTMRIETREAKTPNGVTGPLVSISLLRSQDK